MKKQAIMKNKMVVVLGPTSSGKSDLAVILAKAFGGEVVSADSRQVYKGMDIGTGKVTKKEMGGVPHHLLDVVNPRTVFTVASYKRYAEKAIREILKRGKLPIICGGTGFYIQAIVDDMEVPRVKPDKALRKKLGHKTPKELFGMLKKLDPRRAKSIDPKNPRRLVRAIEIATHLDHVPHLVTKPASQQSGRTNKYKVLQIGVKTADKVLKERIHVRLLARMRVGMVAEARRLHNPPVGEGLSWKRMDALGLEYRYLAKLLTGKMLRGEMMEKLNTAIWQYARRQKTWWRRDKRIKWFSLSEVKKIEKEVEQFLL
ncbi:MAG: tRNA (adenosine(37)-N6)-dimethylallyltransferase MiaA [Patescibacteria group bacterium]|nr:MAG: tRNA (adenosine(37)-N6)-dimethylallyltransferase MiaA [Patescibacteria group bacterium]